MRVFLFRGLAGHIFSLGLDQLANKLQKAGHRASVHSWLERKNVQRKLINEYNNISQQEKIALVGHSLGGNSASFMATNLNASDIEVEYIATIDPTEPAPIPLGIKADNFRSRDFRAEKVSGAKEWHYPELSHIQIDKSNDVHDRILEMCSERLNDSLQVPHRSNKTTKSGPNDSEIMDLLLMLLQRLR